MAGCDLPGAGVMRNPLCWHGYGGYSWNHKLFPDPPAFQAWLHRRNISLMLNLHDMCGEDHCQRGYAEVARAVGMDPSTNRTIPCSFENRALQAALATHELESGENAGVDAWWTDSGQSNAGYWGPGMPGTGTATGPLVGWQCIDDTPQSGLGTREFRSPATLWTSYVRTSRHVQKGKRGFRLGVYGGLGSHRFPLVGSGDTHSAWETLAYQVYMTTAAANVLTAWTHDVGGFFEGHDNTMPANKLRDPELLLRWLQFAVFSPVLRTHCNHCEIRPWLYPNWELLRPTYQLRNALVPYIYSAAHVAHRSGVLPLHGLYVEWPDEEDAYTYSTWNATAITTPPCPAVDAFSPCSVVAPLEYMFGGDMVVSPIVAPIVHGSNHSSHTVWIPPGAWVRWQSGRIYYGPNRSTQTFTLAETPVFVRVGAVIPLKGHDSMHDIAPQKLTLQVILSPAGGSHGNASIYADDGTSLQYAERSAFRLTHVQHISNATSTVLKIVPHAKGDGYTGELTRRSYEVQLLCGGALLNLTSGTVNGAATAAISSRGFGPNNIATSVLSTTELRASLAVTIVAHYQRLPM